MTTTPTAAQPAHLDRGMGLLQATATNIIGMVGVGPFLTIPFMVTAMGGPHILYAWSPARCSRCATASSTRSSAPRCPAAAAVRLPARGYKPFGLGRLMAFVFIFQTIARRAARRSPAAPSASPTTCGSTGRR